MQRHRSPAPNLKWPSEPRWQVKPALRVGLVCNERLISERLLAPGQRLQVGGGVEADLQLDRDYGGESLQLALTPDGLLNLDWGHGVAVRLSQPGHPPSRRAWAPPMGPVTTSLTRLPEPATLRSASGWSRCHGLSI